MIEIPIEIIFGVLAGAGSIIATLAVVIYKTLLSRLTAQDTIIDDLRREVDRLGKGCGIAQCIWK